MVRRCHISLTNAVVCIVLQMLLGDAKVVCDQLKTKVYEALGMH